MAAWVSMAFRHKKRPALPAPGNGGKRGQQPVAQGKAGRRLHGSSSTYSRMSPGWQCSALQMASRVLKRTARTLPVFR